MMQTIDGGGAETDRLLAGMRRSKKSTLREMGLQQARKTYVDMLALLDIAKSPEVDVTVLQVQGQDGMFDLRLSMPPGPAPGRCLVWVHGGGFCVGDAASTDALCGAIAKSAGIAVAAVDYRRPPEHSLDLAIADVARALAWCAATFPNSALALGGDSAGGSLALNAIMGENDVFASRLDRLLLCYPLGAAAPATPSRERYGSGHFLTADDLDWFMGMAAAGKSFDPRIELLSRTRWKALPPTLVLLAGRDPLHDEGRQLAELLTPFADSLQTLYFPELVHGFLHMGGYVRFVQEVHQRIGRFLSDPQG